MPYVERRNGVIVSLYANAQPGYAEQWMDDADGEVVAFLNRSAQEQPLALTQIACARLTVDNGGDWGAAGTNGTAGNAGSGSNAGAAGKAANFNGKNGCAVANEGGTVSGVAA